MNFHLPRICSVLSASALVLSFSFSICDTAHAADAFFSADGKTVTTIVNLPSSLTGLVQVDAASGKVSPLPLPPAFTDAGVESIAQGAEGELLFLSQDAIWLYQPGAAPKKVTPTAPVTQATDLFVDVRKGSPTEGWLFLSGIVEADGTPSPQLFARKPGAKKFSSIFCRRVDDVHAGAFGPDGRLYFTSSADIWEGGLSVEEDGEERLGTLVGARIAPLAFLNTDGANGGGMWVTRVQSSGGWVYALLRGRHMGSIVRTPVLAKPLYGSEEGDFPTLQQSFTTNAKAIADTEILADDFEDIHGFCVTEQNSQPQLFFYTFPGEENQGPALYLWNGSGKPKIIGHLPPSQN